MELSPEVFQDVLDYFPSSCTGSIWIFRLAGLPRHETLPESSVKISTKILSNPEMLAWGAGLGLIFSEKLMRSMIAQGYLDCVKFLRYSRAQEGWTCPWGKKCSVVAAKFGQLETLKYILNQEIHGEYINKSQGLCCWDDEAVDSAVENGHLDCLKIFHLDFLEFYRGYGSTWNIQTTVKAAKSGKLDCLKYLHEQGCFCDSKLAETMIRSKGFERQNCLKCLSGQDCSWNSYVTLKAVKGGYLDCLKYLLEQGCPWDKAECLESAKDPEIRKFIMNN